MTRARGFSLVEVLTAAALISGLGLPVFLLSMQNARSLGADQVRLVAEHLARATVERMSVESAVFAPLLAPSPTDSDVSVAVDPWQREPARFDELAGVPLAALVASHGLSLKLELIRHLALGTDLLVCEVSWFPEGDRHHARTHVTRLRPLVRDHLHDF